MMNRSTTIARLLPLSVILAAAAPQIAQAVEPAAKMAPSPRVSRLPTAHADSPVPVDHAFGVIAINGRVSKPSVFIFVDRAAIVLPALAPTRNFVTRIVSDAMARPL